MDSRIEVIGIDHGWSMMKSVSERGYTFSIVTCK